MTTEIDLYVLRQMTELAAAQELMAMEKSTLQYVGQLRGIRVKRGADKADLVAAILELTHPRPAPPVQAPQFEQLTF